MLLGMMFGISACQVAGMTGTPTATSPISTSTSSPPPVKTTLAATETYPAVTATQERTVPSPTQPAFDVCSPLEYETWETLTEIITNPLDIPPFGQDIGHHGVDFAYYRRGDRLTIQGVTVYAILDGTTVLTLKDKMPYGYAIVIETPLDQLPEELKQTLLEACLPVPEDPGYRLNCPDMPAPAADVPYSVYHLYAHLETLPNFSPGDVISCGTRLATVGNSGYSSNPHLHLETRIGPSGLNYTSMMHYSAAATESEMAAYCQWRMSGYYQLFDPFLLLEAVTTK